MKQPNDSAARTFDVRSLQLTELRRQIAETQMSKCGAVQKEPSKVG